MKRKRIRSQKEGVACLGTISPTPAAALVIPLPSVACERDLDLFQIDTERALIQSELARISFSSSASRL